MTREDTITRWMPLARWCANGYDAQDEDVRQVAYIGLIKAVDQFDPSRGFAFSSYATTKIRGEIQRHYRDSVWMVRPPRPLRSDPETQARCRHAAELPDTFAADDDGIAQVEDRAILAPVLAGMRPVRRQALALRHIGDLTQREIAARLGYSQMQVSRLLRGVA